jgi:DNA-directed RNA polymerase specialized sigma24 family protein
MAPADDWGLLRRYARERDEAAFAQLVRRHVNLVFSAALRRTGDRHMADDVTQAVFVILAQKSKSLCNGDGALSAWLLKSVRYASANAIKMENRRRKHERAAADPGQRVSAHGAGAGACSSNPTDVLPCCGTSRTARSPRLRPS